MNKTIRRTRKSKNKPSMYKGLPLVDANDDLEVEITKADVLAAKRKAPNSCAAAKALSRSLHTEAEVHISRTYLRKGNKWIKFITPSSIAREITSFDRSSIFEPGDYTLKAPSVRMRLGTYRGNYNSKKNTGKKRKHHITINIRESAR
jgi:hypothetical protein